MRIFRSDRARRLRDPTKHAVSLVGSKECVEYDNVRLSSLRARAPARRALPLSRHVLLQLLDELRRDLDVPNLGTRRASAAPGVFPACSRRFPSWLPPPRRHHSRAQTASTAKRQPPGSSRRKPEPPPNGDPVPKPPPACTLAPRLSRSHARSLGVPVRRRGVRARARLGEHLRGIGKAHRALRRSRRTLPIVLVVVVVGVLELVQRDDAVGIVGPRTRVLRALGRADDKVPSPRSRASRGSVPSRRSSRSSFRSDPLYRSVALAILSTGGSGPGPKKPGSMCSSFSMTLMMSMRCSRLGRPTSKGPGQAPQDRLVHLHGQRFVARTTRAFSFV